MDNKTLTIKQRLTRLEDAVFGRKEQPKHARTAKAPDFSGPTGGVRFLISKGSFKKKKTLAEVRTALSDHDYHYSAQAVQMALTRQSGRRGLLTALNEGSK